MVVCPAVLVGEVRPFPARRAGVPGRRARPAALPAPSVASIGLHWTDGSERGPVALPVFKIGRSPLCGGAGFDSQALPPDFDPILLGYLRFFAALQGRWNTAANDQKQAENGQRRPYLTGRTWHSGMAL